MKVKLVRRRSSGSGSGTITQFWNGSAFTTTSALVDATASNASIFSAAPANVNWTLDSNAPTASALDAGVYTVYSYAYDAAGNVKASVSRSFTITQNVIFSPAASSAGGS